MKTILVDHIEADVKKEDVLARFGMPADHAFGEAIAEVIEEMKGIANAKLLYGEAKIEARTEDTVTIDGVVFHGRDLVNALEGLDTVYPYLCTCGKELDGAAWGCKDLVKMLYIDNINHFYLRQTAIVLAEKIDNELGTVSTCMTPGSFEEWTLEEQQPLWQLLNKGENTGVTMNDHGIMNPAKTVAGIRFQAKKGSCNCAICMKHNCENRKEEFSAKVFEDTLC